MNSILKSAWEEYNKHGEYLIPKIHVNRDIIYNSYINDLTNFIVFLKKDKKHKKYFGNACYMHFNYLENIRYIVDFHKSGDIRENFDKEIALEYIDWLINKSYWKGVFETKNTEQVFERGVIVNCEFPAQFVVQALISLRYLREKPQIVKNWNTLSKLTDKSIALYLSHFYYINNKKITFNIQVCNHSWGYYRHGRNIIKHIINKDYSFGDYPPMRENSKYRGIMEIYGDENPILIEGISSSEPVMLGTGVFKKTLIKLNNKQKRQSIFTPKNMKLAIKEMIDLNLDEKKELNVKYVIFDDFY